MNLYVDVDAGIILGQPDHEPLDVVDLKGLVLAPAFLELHTNGCLGVHFTHYEDDRSYQENLEKVSRYFLSQGVGAF